MNSFNSFVNNNLGWVHNNKMVLPVVSLILGMYAALARPKLPKFIEKLFENTVFRIILISYLIYRGNQDPQLSIMIAAAFLITMHLINKQKVSRINLKKVGRRALRKAKKMALKKVKKIAKVREGMEDSVEEGMEDSVEEGMEDSVEEGMEDSVEEGMEDSVEEGMEDSVEEGMEDIVE